MKFLNIQQVGPCRLRSDGSTLESSGADYSIIYLPRWRASGRTAALECLYRAETYLRLINAKKISLQR